MPLAALEVPSFDPRTVPIKTWRLGTRHALSANAQMWQQRRRGQSSQPGLGLRTDRLTGDRPKINLTTAVRNI
jgi:hypothetical protein